MLWIEARCFRFLLCCLFFLAIGLRCDLRYTIIMAVIIAVRVSGVSCFGCSCLRRFHCFGCSCLRRFHSEKCENWKSVLCFTLSLALSAINRQPRGCLALGAFSKPLCSLKMVQQIGAKTVKSGSRKAGWVPVRRLNLGCFQKLIWVIWFIF